MKPTLSGLSLLLFLMSAALSLSACQHVAESQGSEYKQDQWITYSGSISTEVWAR